MLSWASIFFHERNTNAELYVFPFDLCSTIVSHKWWWVYCKPFKISFILKFPINGRDGAQILPCFKGIIMCTCLPKPKGRKQPLKLGSIWKLLFWVIHWNPTSLNTACCCDYWGVRLERIHNKSNFMWMWRKLGIMKWTVMNTLPSEDGW